MSFVADASLTIAWVFEDEATARTRLLLNRAVTDGFHVSSMWPLEVSNVLLVSERRGRTPSDKVIPFLDSLMALSPIIDMAPGHARILAVIRAARLYQLTSYDASYLELALRLDLPIATNDRKLEAAAKTAGLHTL